MLTKREKYNIRTSEDFIRKAKRNGFVVSSSYTCVKMLVAWIKEEKITYQLFRLANGNYKLVFNK